MAPGPRGVCRQPRVAAVGAHSHTQPLERAGSAILSTTDRASRYFSSRHPGNGLGFLHEAKADAASVFFGWRAVLAASFCAHSATAMSGFRGVAEAYEAQWTAHLNSAVANAFRQTLAEKPPDPVARIGRLLTARVDGPAPQFVPPPASPWDPMSQAQSDTAYNRASASMGKGGYRRGRKRPNDSGPGGYASRQKHANGEGDYPPEHVLENPAFETYYRESGIVPEAEWDAVWKPWPTRPASAAQAASGELSEACRSSGQPGAWIWR